MEANMAEVIRFVPLAERERLRLIQEARAIYDSIFPCETVSGRHNATSVLRADLGHGDDLS
jgi:hypothetical protein